MPAPRPPALESFGSFGGDWSAYEEHLRKVFRRDVVRGALRMGHEPVKCSDQRFWHCISEGPDESDRHVDLCRAQRIRWLAWIIRNANRHPEIDRTDDEDADTITLCFRNEYTVVLKRSYKGLSLRTAYCVR